MLAMPIVGFLAVRVARRGLCCLACRCSRFVISYDDVRLGVDFRPVMLARVLQSLGLAFPVRAHNTGFSSLPRDRTTRRRDSMNRPANIGGSVGISFVTTGLARRAQVHQDTLVEKIKRRSAVSVGIAGE